MVVVLSDLTDHHNSVLPNILTFFLQFQLLDDDDDFNY